MEINPKLKEEEEVKKLTQGKSCVAILLLAHLNGMYSPLFFCDDMFICVDLLPSIFWTLLCLWCQSIFLFLSSFCLLGLPSMKILHDFLRPLSFPLPLWMVSLNCLCDSSRLLFVLALLIYAA